MREKVTFPSTVMLIDVPYLNRVIVDFKENFQQRLNRPLQDLDVPHFITCLALDASVPVENRETQVIMLYDKFNSQLSFSNPSSLEDELNGVAFQDNHLGEFMFSSLSPEGLASNDNLYLELLQILIEASEVKRIITVSSDATNEVIALNETNGKKITLFGFRQIAGKEDYKWQMLGYPVMHAFGIAEDEI